MTAGLKLRDVLGYVESLKTELRARGKDLEAQKGIVRGQAAELARLRGEVARLDGLVNTPEIQDFARAVVLEAAHQRERWTDAHDAGKTDADWFWLIGYLGGKALRPDCTSEKRAHRIVALAAAAANWHRRTMMAEASL